MEIEQSWIEGGREGDYFEFTLVQDDDGRGSTKPCTQVEASAAAVAAARRQKVGVFMPVYVYM